MRPWLRIWSLIFLVPLFSTQIYGSILRNSNIQLLGFRGPFLCKNIYFPEHELINAGLKACSIQNKFDHCPLLESCGLLKKFIAPEKYKGVVYTHKRSTHLMWPLRELDFPFGEYKNKIASSNFYIFFSQSFPYIDQMVNCCESLQVK